MKKNRKKEGYVTVYLSFSLLIMLSLIFTLIEGIRIQTIRFQTECVMDIGLSSIFAEYHRQLLDQYDLFAIDTAYGYEQADEKRTESHLLQYMNMNFAAQEKNRIPAYKDLTALHADNAALSEVTYLSDEKGAVLTYQIIQYMKEKTGLSIAEDLIPKDFSKKEKEYAGLESQKNGRFNQIDEILETINAQKEEGEDKITINNPADRIKSMAAAPILSFAVKNSSDISCKQAAVSSYISHRDIREGAGLRKEQNTGNKLLEKKLFMQYLFEKCGCFYKEKEEGVLSYQLEYLLYGKGSDMENLSAFAEQIFKIRYVTNAAYLFTNPAKKMEASSLAAAVTAGIGSPPLYEAVKYTILFAWCYAESIQDLRIIFDGKKAAVVKNDVFWNIPLSNLLQFSSSLDSYKEAENGMSYQDYLKSFLFMKEEKVICMRLMDLMEMDIRQTVGNQNFKIDHCIYGLKAKVNVSSGYGYGYSISREYSYE